MDTLRTETATKTTQENPMKAPVSKKNTTHPRASASALLPMAVAGLCVFVMLAAVARSSIVSDVLTPLSSRTAFGPTTGNEMADFIESHAAQRPDYPHRQELIKLGRSIGDQPILPAIQKHMFVEPGEHATAD